MPYISATSYDSFRTCPRLFFWKHIVKLELAREEGARRFGSLFHAGLETWWKTMDGGDVPWRNKDAALVDAMGAIAENARHIATDPWDVAKAEVLIMAYHARYYELEFETVTTPIDQPDDQGGVEKWFNLDLLDENGHSVPNWRLTGRKDAIKRFADGRVKPVEHKTTGQDIGVGADYWKDIAIDTQVSIYVDVTQRLGFKSDRLVYDVVRRPMLKSLLATPEDKRKFTKGKGCKACGGRAGGKDGVKQGKGCDACKNTGWSEAPTLYEKQRLEDESIADYRVRIADDIHGDPDSYMRMVDVTRTEDQIAEARADMVVTTAEITSLTSLMKSRATGVEDIAARRCYPRNTQACLTIYGRPCDYINICNGEAPDPFHSKLYQIQKKGT